MKTLNKLIVLNFVIGTLNMLALLVPGHQELNLLCTSISYGTFVFLLYMKRRGLK